MHKRKLWSWNLSLLVVLPLLGGLPAAAQPPNPPPVPPGRQPLIQAPLIQPPVAEDLRSGHLVMNYENIDIKVLAKIMAQLTGRNVIVDDSVQGKVTMLSSREITPDEAWEIFKATLLRAGYGFRQRGPFLQVLPTVEARREAPLYSSKGGPGEGMAVAALIMKEGDAAQLLTAIRPLLSDPNAAQAFPGSKAIVLLEKRDTILKISEIMHRLDQVTPKLQVSVLFPQYLETEKLAPILQTAMLHQVLLPGEQPVRIVAFPPTNSLVIQGTAEQIIEAKKVLEELDIARAAPLTIEKPRYFLYRLHNADSEEIAKILTQMLSERKALLAQQQASARLNQPGAPNQPQTQPQPQPANNTTQPTAATAADAGKRQDLAFVSAKVSSDKETNSVVVYVSPSEYDQIRNLLGALDVARKQILVQVVVAEMSLTKVLNLGTDLQSFSPQGIAATLNGGVTQEGLLSLLTGGSFIAGFAGGGSRTVSVQGTDVQVPTFFAFIKADKQNNEFNLISSPRLMATDHKKATLKVGNVVPFPTGARFSQNGQPLVTYDYKDVGIKLEFTPHMSQSESIRMELSQEVAEVTSFLQQNLGGTGYSIPLISTRKFTTDVTLRSGETLIIGGLISKRTTETIQKVPLLGDIPLIQALFTQLSKNDAKTTLFVSLTPYVIHSPTDVARIDRAYEMFLKGQGNPGDEQNEARNTGPSRHEVPDPYAPDARNLSAPQIRLGELAVANPRGDDRLRQPRVVVQNGEGDVELVLREVVRRPDGHTEEFKTEKLRMTAGQSREVTLPPYQFPLEKGTYEFDLEAVVSDRVVARIPVPKKVKLQEP